MRNKTSPFNKLVILNQKRRDTARYLRGDTHLFSEFYRRVSGVIAYKNSTATSRQRGQSEDKEGGKVLPAFQGIITTQSAQQGQETRRGRTGEIHQHGVPDLARIHPVAEQTMRDKPDHKAHQNGFKQGGK